MILVLKIDGILFSWIKKIKERLQLRNGWSGENTVNPCTYQCALANGFLIQILSPQDPFPSLLGFASIKNL